MVEAKKILGSGEGHEAADVEQSDAGGEEEGFAEIVGDEDDGFLKAAGEGAKFALEFGTGDGIESREGLVHEQNGGIGGESAGYADALALATREFAGVTGGKVGGIEADEGEEFVDASGDAGGGPVLERGNEGDVLSDSEVRKEAGVLDNVSDATAELKGVDIGSGTTVYGNLTTGGQEQPIDEAKKSGFATATATEKDEGFATGNGKGDAGEDGRIRNIVYVIADIVKFD